MALASWIGTSQPSRAERLYMAVAAGLCIGLLLSYTVGSWLEGHEQQQSRTVLADGRDSATPGFIAPASSARTSASSGATRQDAAPAILPSWVQAARGTKLWSAATGGASLATVNQWQFLKVLGADARRFEVTTPPTDAPAAVGWVDVDDVGISGPPSEWVLATSDARLYSAADSPDALGTVPSGTALVVSGEGTTDRLFVYWPGDVSRRTGYGWIANSTVVPTTAPAGASVPSPQFRAVPKSRPGTYRVQLGDTVESIAVRFSTGRDDLFRLNGLDPASRLVVGQLLQVPSPGDPAAALQSTGPRKVREISPGWVSADNAVVIDDASGEILWARNANSPIAPASLTKIVTSLVTLDHANLAEHVTVHVDSRRMPESTVMGLQPGEELTVEDLLYGLMLPSGNDAALALAEHIAGTRVAFANLMNEKAKSLGLTGSNFVNPHGLDADGHYSSAYDMAMLGRAGLRDATFRLLASERSYETPRGRGHVVHNLNQLLWRYPGADGVKIGFTDAAGRAIVGSATRNGHRVIVAMMRSNDIYADSAALLDWAFGSYSWDQE